MTVRIPLSQRWGSQTACRSLKCLCCPSHSSDKGGIPTYRHKQMGPATGAPTLHSRPLKWLSLLQDVRGRMVTILRHKGVVVCMDRVCSHFGGPLGNEGDIEEMGSRSCIKCPWHGYMVRPRILIDVSEGSRGSVRCRKPLRFALTRILYRSHQRNCLSIY